MTSATETSPKKKSGGLADIRKAFGGGQSTLRQFGILGSLIVIIVFFQIMTDGLTLSPTNPALIGLAGLILIVSSFFRGWLMGLFVVSAAALALFGRTAGIPPFRVPILGTIRPSDSSLSLSVVLAALGLLFGRSRRI